MSEPLVTIMMPTYRRPAYLRGALSAAVGQTYSNLQIIVRDNASGDETPAVVREFDDPRIEFHQSSATTNPAKNGGECLRLARGKYSMTLADDDTIEPNYVEVLSHALESNDEISVSYAGGFFVDDLGQKTGEKKPNGSYTVKTLSFLMAWCHGELPLVTPASMMLRTDWLREVASELGENDFPQGHHSDTAFMIWVALRGKIFFTDQTSYSYRVHVGNTWVRLTSQQNLMGDDALLKFIERQRLGAAGTCLTADEWRLFEEEARDQLAKTYYWRMIGRQPRDCTIGAYVSDLFIKPLKIYGARRVATRIVNARSDVKSWFKDKIMEVFRKGGNSEPGSIRPSEL